MQEQSYQPAMVIRISSLLPTMTKAERAVSEYIIEHPQDVIHLSVSELAEAKEQHVHGKETTPFLLARVVELTGGDSLESNIKLVLNNATVAAKTAAELAK